MNIFKKNLKSLCVSILTMVLILNSFTLVLADGGNLNQFDNFQILKSEGPRSEPLGDKFENMTTDLSISVKDVEQSDPLYLPPTDKQSMSTMSMRSQQTKYTLADLNRLSYNEMIEAVASVEWSDIEGLFQGSDDAKRFYTHDRVQALINALVQRGSQYTVNDDKGIPTLVEVLRSGYYLGFYNQNSGFGHLNTREVHNKALPAIKSIINNPNFALGTKVQDEVVSSVGSLIWNASCDIEVVQGVTRVLEDYNRNMSKYETDSLKGTAIYNLMRGIEYDISYYIGWESSEKPRDTQWFGRMDPFIEVIKDIALYSRLNDDNEWLVNNGIFSIGELGRFHYNDKIGIQTLEQVMRNHRPALSQQYFEAVSRIIYVYDGIDSQGNKLDWDEIKRQGEQKYYPNTYTFDNGAVVIRTGDKVTKDKVQRLYWASKEVRSQFVRTTGRDDPLEKGNTDDILTAIIYNSPDEYTMNSTLNGLDTNNGGMYIESYGTFYTYERTPAESIYTLEELFRHEFTHYLQGRYVVPGMWGDSPNYTNDRLTWYEEGGAEYFAGSTRTEGVLPRKTMVGGIDPSRMFPLSKALKSSYNDGFEFYTYVCMFINYIAENDYYVYDKLTNHLMNGELQAFDDYVRQLSNDSNLDRQYTKFMEDLVKRHNELTIPLVSDDYFKTHPEKDFNEIYEEIQQLTNMKDIKFTENKADEFKTFKLKGTYTGGTTAGRPADRQAMNDIADDFLKTLNGYEWSGYETVTSYFTDYRVNKDNQFEFDLVFHGILTGDSLPPIVDETKLVANANGTYNGTQGEAINFSSRGSNAADEATIDSYIWIFGDGNVSKEANPTHVYKTSGEFEVTLIVRDSNGMSAVDVTTAKAEVSGQPPISDGITEETEPNDIFEEANGPIVYGKQVYAEINNPGESDIFFFEVPVSGKINIEVEVDNKYYPNLSWWLYKESDTSNGVAYPFTSEDGKYIGEYDAEPGKYYLHIWGTDEYTTDYTININSEVDLPIIEEKEMPVANINGPYTGLKGEEVLFSSEGSHDPDGTIESYLWIFGDGNTSTLANPSNIYEEAGEFLVTLVVFNNEGMSSAKTTTFKITDVEG